MKPLRLEEILSATRGRLAQSPSQPLATGKPAAADSETIIRRICIDSRQAQSGDLFVAIAGENFDGHAFLAQALEKGASAAIVNKPATTPAASNVAQPPSAVQGAWDASLAAKYPGRIIEVANTIAALGMLGAYYRSRVSAKVIAVTGSNGKTTVKRMIQHILSKKLKGTCSPKSFNNNIGVPLTLLAVDEDDDYVVCEVGTNAPGEIAELAAICKPDIAVITSVGETHLEKLGNIELVAVEKASMLSHLKKDGVAIVWNDSLPLAQALKPYQDVPTATFGDSCKSTTSNGATPNGATAASSAAVPSRQPCNTCQPDLNMVEFKGESNRVSFKAQCRLGALQSSRSEASTATDSAAAAPVPGAALQICGWVPQPGRHSAVNSLAAIAVAVRMGLDAQESADALANFGGVEMRLESIQAGPVRIINDAYNANPSSVMAAADVLGDQDGTRRVMVVGDMRELGDASQSLHERTGRDIARRRIDLLIGVGPLGRYIASGAAQAGMASESFESVESASSSVPSLLKAGDVVLVKGSRAMAMEKLIGPLKTAFERNG